EKRTTLYSETDPTVLQAQLGAFHDELQRTQRDLEEYRRVNNLYRVDAQISKIGAMASDLETTAAATGQRLAALRQASAEAEEAMRTLSGDHRLFTDAEGEITRSAEKRLLDLMVEEARLTLAAPESTNMIGERRDDEARVKAEIEKQRDPIVTKMAPPDRDRFQQLVADRYEVEADIARSLAKQDNARSQLEGAKQQLAALETLRQGMDALVSQTKAAQAVYESYAARVAEGRAAAALD